MFYCIIVIRESIEIIFQMQCLNFYLKKQQFFLTKNHALFVKYNMFIFEI
jgi:hypothetical protein